MQNKTNLSGKKYSIQTYWC